MDIASNLRRLRETAGLSQAQVAQQLHITRQAYNHYETGRSLPTLEALEALAQLYDTDLAEILGKAGLRFDLSEQEQKLIDAYRQLTVRQQLIILGRTLEYLEVDEYKKQRHSNF